MTPPRVFISYSHDSEPHRQAVLALTQRLRVGGIDAIVDQFVNGSPAQGWPRWMLDELEAARYVLCVCTPTYYVRFRGHEQPGSGKGVDWEGWVISQDLYDANGRNERFIPVLLGESKYESIPELLRSASHYRLETDFQKLYDVLLGQAGVKPAPLGEPRLKLQPPESDPSPPSEPPQDALSPQEEARLVAECYLATVEALDRILENYPAVATWLGLVCPQLVTRTGKVSRLSDAARHRQFVASEHFKSMNGFLTRFSGSRSEWESLRQVVGGLAVLAVNRQWVLAQRRAWKRGESAVFPGHDGIQSMHDGRWANFLPLATAAMAQGIADLGRVFGGPDRRFIDDLPEVPRGLGPDREHEYRIFFIRAVLHRDLQKSFDESNVDQVNSLFEDVQEALKVAAEDNDPFYGSQTAATTFRTLVRNDLDLVDLLLLKPSGKGGIRDVISDPVRFFHSLHAIFETTQSRLVAP
jgi:hypothetical protein